jgi:hypothetical protein
MAINFPWFKRPKSRSDQNENGEIQNGASVVDQSRAVDVAVISSAPPGPAVPQKVFIERMDDVFDSFEYSVDPPATVDKFYSVLYGGYAMQNFVELFYSLPEVFAPINEIASRVADANWQLLKSWNDEIDYSDPWFNEKFEKPNALTSMRDMVYNAVCYEILTGRQFFYKNKPDELPDEYKSILSWGNLPAHAVNVLHRENVDPYSSTSIEDFINGYTVPLENGNIRRFEPNEVMPIVHFSLDKPNDFNRSNPKIRAAAPAIRNLLPVYEARGTIYLKRGSMGFWVSKKEDADGTVSLNKQEKRELRNEHNSNYGLTNGRDPIGISGAPIDFVRSGMSIQELQPFDETLADAAAIYGVMRVPPHLIPRKDHSTFANAAADMKSFYINVIIPWATRYAQIWTNDFRLRDFRRWIKPNYDHIGELQENKKEASEVDKQKTDTAILRYEKGITTRNEMLAELGYKSIPDGDTYVGDPKNAAPFGVRVPVGTLTAFQAILSDGNISDDAKKNILVIVFGIPESDAAKLVIPKPEPTVEPGAPDPAAPGENKPFKK